VEIATAGPPDQLDDALRILFGEIPTVRGGFRRQGSDAVEHLFRIVAGLESPVVGEREILVQFRQAAAAAANIGATNGAFRGLFDAAIASARCIRGELPNPQESMASIAAGLTEPANRVAVLGHGAMGKCIIEALLALPHRPIVEVFARRPEAIDTKGVIARSLAEAPEALATLPAVISVTSAKTRLIPADQLAALLSTRTDPLTMIDMAMPPDFFPPSGAAVRYFDIDDLADLARDRTPTEQADRMVAESAAAFMHKMWAGKRTGAVIENLFGQADDAVNEVVERFAKKLNSPEDRAILEQTAHTAVRKLLHRPVRYLSGDGVGDATTVAAAFGIGLDD
jgi:glutamyl-tRNA reductase